MTNLLIALVNFQRLLKGLPEHVIIVVGGDKPGREDVGRLPIIRLSLAEFETQPIIYASPSILLGTAVTSYCIVIYPPCCSLFSKFPRPPLSFGLAKLRLGWVLT